MLEMRFAGLVRFVSRALARPHPANSDASPSGAVARIAMLPEMPVAGVNWTRHVRPWRPLPPTGRRAHLRVVK
jgi:hypothetical protein